MKKTTLFTSLALATVLSSAALPSFADAPLRTSVKWLPLTEVISAVEKAGFTNIEEIERDDGVYEVYATAKDGARTKLYVDPQNGEILKQRVLKNRHDHF